MSYYLANAELYFSEFCMIGVVVSFAMFGLNIWNEIEK
jgi:hypothetical protein